MLTPAQARAAAAIVETRARDLPHLRPLADALHQHADETRTETETDNEREDE